MCGAHLNRLHSCLYCVFFGCFTKKHIHEHAKNKRHNLGKQRTYTHSCFGKSFWSKSELTNRKQKSQNRAKMIVDKWYYQDIVPPYVQGSVPSRQSSHSHAPLWPTAASATISEGLQHYFGQLPPLSRRGAEPLSNRSTLPFWWERLIQSNVMGLSYYTPLHTAAGEG